MPLYERVYVVQANDVHLDTKPISTNIEKNCVLPFRYYRHAQLFPKWDYSIEIACWIRPRIEFFGCVVDHFDVAVAASSGRILWRRGAAAAYDESR